MKNSEAIKIFDTTLRDGEQTPGVGLTPDEKLEIARALDRLGVDTIEAGFPITSKGEIEGMRMIANAGLRAEIAGLARAHKSDIDIAVSTGIKCIHVFLATSDIHLQHKLNMTREEALQTAVRYVKYAKEYGVQVEFSAEDACRSDTEYLLRVFQAVSDAGADRIDIPDTVGVMHPVAMYNLVSKVKNAVNIPISIHCHNDFGLAVANSLAAVEAGAERVHCTINGLGERAGNASLEEVVMSLHNLYGRKTNINTRLIYETSKLVSRLTGIVVQPNKAIVGENAFGHESGIHTHGLLNMPLTYEPLEPELVGRKRWIQAGKHAGSHGIKAMLDQLAISVNDGQLKEIVTRVKDLGDKGKRLTDADLESIAYTVLGKVQEEKILQLVDLSVMTGTKSMPTASVKLLVDGEPHVVAETGVGPIDAAIKAIQKLGEGLGNIKLSDYRLDAITGGTDALGEVSVKVEDKDGLVATAKATNEDVVVASVQAMIEGMNRLLLKRRVVQPKVPMPNP
ncbi:MAG: 2-isopropylmalate synthase [Thaumarchaeota archaeon]|nr:2-isopropylmalate synthase [Nitrososphaerota archaeon]